MRAAQFLDRFRRDDAQGSPIAAFIDDPDGWIATLTEMPDALDSAMRDAVRDTHGAPAEIKAEGFASAACARDGSVLVAGARFADWFEGIDPVAGAVRGIGPGCPRVSLFADDRTGRAVALAAGIEAVARNWPLDPRVRAALHEGHARFAVVAFRPDDRSWQSAASTFSLTRAEAGLVAALGRHGDLQRAARERGVAYETARKFVASAMRKTGTRRQTELVRQTLATVAGDVSDSARLVGLTRDLFALTERQARLAVLVARGATREGAAVTLGLSDNRAKADLKIVFQACGVDSAVDLARIMAEVNALEGLASACEVTIEPPGRAAEPLRLIPRSHAGGRIAVADHGPPEGVPVIVMHSNVSGRHHPRATIAAMQAAGFRPICWERSGFGLTDYLPGNVTDVAVADFHDVLDVFALERAVVLARCTSASFAICAAAACGRVAAAVLLDPDSPLRPNRPQTRMTDHARTLFQTYPQLAESFASLLARRTSAALVERMWRRASAGVARDLALLDDPHELGEIVRGAQQAARGLYGFTHEALSAQSGAPVAPVADARGWSVIFGHGDETHDIGDYVAFWRDALPQAQVDIVGQGAHFLHATHTAEVIAALHRAHRHACVTNVAPPRESAALAA